MTSGLKLDDPSYPSSEDPAEDLQSTARKLHDGLTRKLRNQYGMDLKDRRWRPVSPAEIEL